MLKVFSKFVSLIFCFLFISVNLISQSIYSPENIHAALDDFNISNPVEKAYIHTDRKYYSVGEVVWFQTYLVAGPRNIPSPLSSIVYVDLYNKEGLLLEKKKVFSDSGFGHGYLELKDGLPAGSYFIKGYSNWMKNNDQNYFFEKEIVVIDKFWNSKVAISDEVDLQFFPEGGYLVEGVRSRLGFKAIDDRGKGVDFRGKIVNQKGDKIGEIDSEHRGMGSFSFTPKVGDTYHALIDGSQKIHNLPKVEKQGFVLWVDILERTLRIRVRSKGVDRTQKYSMIIHTRGEVVYAFEPNLDNETAIIELPLNYFLSGLAHISLLDSDANILSDRLIFVSKKSVQVDVTGIQKQYSLRSKVEANINLKNSKGDPLKGVFSVSVIDLSQTFDQKPSKTIVSNLLLTSDLKGNIEDPMYYFDLNNTNAKNHLDLLLLTQGWSRFTWDEVLKEERPEPSFKFEKGFEIEGMVKKISNNKVEEGATVTFLNRNITPPLLVETKSDENGYFNLTNLQYFEDHKIVIQGKNKNNRSTVRLEIDSIASESSDLQVSFNSLETFDLESNILNHFNQGADYRKLTSSTNGFDSTKFRDLGKFVVEAERGEQNKGNVNNVYGASDYTVSFEQTGTSAFNNPFQALQGRIPGVKIELTGSAISISVRDAIGYGSKGELSSLSPMILLDDSPVRIEDISALSATAFDRVEVYKGASTGVFGSQGGAGVLAFYTKTGAEVVAMTADKAKGIYALMLKNGYSKPKLFYSPKYNVQLPEHVNPDKRLVIDWKAMNLTDESGNKNIEFWNSDEASEFLIDLQGLTFEGEPFSFWTIYRVNK